MNPGVDAWPEATRLVDDGLVLAGEDVLQGFDVGLPLLEATSGSLRDVDSSSVPWLCCVAA